MTDSNYQGPDAEKIRSMFDTIASRYDVANNVMSAGIHHLWRRTLVEWSGARPGSSVLDCATGTGDLAIEFKRAVGAEGHVIGTDFSSEMLKPAPAKAQSKGLQIDFQQADVMHLPFADNEFDIASISFGIRNVQDPVKGLSELARVVKPGGTVLVLEFGQPFVPGFQQVYDFYSKRILPRIGGMLTGQQKAYRYLQESSSLFPCREKFLEMMDQSHRFASSEYRPLSFGIAYMYKGVVGDKSAAAR
jgi:demethylmenaquinone methyltransferase/2-methoxy-6-polyprenyl-1,4-benzoquinol methylase